MVNQTKVIALQVKNHNIAKNLNMEVKNLWINQLIPEIIQKKVKNQMKVPQKRMIKMKKVLSKRKFILNAIYQKYQLALNILYKRNLQLKIFFTKQHIHKLEQVKVLQR
jgi:hypothetical protein